MPDSFIGLKCPQCNNRISDTDNICPHCGLDLNAPLRDDELVVLAEPYIKRARNAIEGRGNLYKALSSCDRALEYLPQSAEVHNLRGLILDGLDKSDEAIEEYQEAIRLRTDYVEARENLADAEAELQHPKTAYGVGTNIRHLQGRALIASALVMVLVFIFRFAGLNSIEHLGEILTIIYSLFFIVGLPGIQSTQPQTKYWGKIGLILMSIPALERLLTMLIILFVQSPLELNDLIGSILDPLVAVGVLFLGYILVGWLTIQARVFPTWLGWLLLMIGILYDAIYLIMYHGGMDAFVSSVYFSIFLDFMSLLEVVALIGYGVNIIKYKFPREKRTQQSVP